MGSLDKGVIVNIIILPNGFWLSLIFIYAKGDEEEELIQAQRRAAADRSRHKSHGRIQYQGTYFLT